MVRRFVPSANTVLQQAATWAILAIIGACYLGFCWLMRTQVIGPRHVALQIQKIEKRYDNSI